MQLHRQFIERTDFSSARRGYEPIEVQEHLRSIADSVEELRSKPSEPTTLAGTAAERVRVILDAAEQSAEGIREQARDEADSLLGEARQQATQTRQRAEVDARRHMDEVQRATDTLLARASRLESEIDGVMDRLRDAAGAVVETLRGEGTGLQADLESLRSDLASVRASAGPVDTGAAEASEQEAVVEEWEVEEVEFEEPAVEERVERVRRIDREPDTVTSLDEPTDEGERFADTEVLEPVEDELELEEAEPTAAPDEPVAEPTAGQDVAEPEPAELEEEEIEAQPEPAGSRGGGSSEGARLIALNMALNGTPREETADYLRREFNLADDRMLDEVYARVRH